MRIYGYSGCGSFDEEFMADRLIAFPDASHVEGNKCKGPYKLLSKIERPSTNTKQILESLINHLLYSTVFLQSWPVIKS